MVLLLCKGKGPLVAFSEPFAARQLMPQALLAHWSHHQLVSMLRCHVVALLGVSVVSTKARTPASTCCDLATWHID